MILQQAENDLAIQEPSAQIMDVLLKAADSVLARYRARTLRPYSDGIEPQYEPAIDPVDIRLCA